MGAHFGAKGGGYELWILGEEGGVKRWMEGSISLGFWGERGAERMYWLKWLGLRNSV